MENEQRKRMIELLEDIADLREALRLEREAHAETGRELHEWRMKRLHGGCEEDRLAEVARRVEAETALDAERQRSKRLEEVATRAAAELRHAWKGGQLVAPHRQGSYRTIDGNLVSKAIQLLERALSHPGQNEPKEAEGDE